MIYADMITILSESYCVIRIERRMDGGCYVRHTKIESRRMSCDETLHVNLGNWLHTYPMVLFPKPSDSEIAV